MILALGIYYIIYVVIFIPLRVLLRLLLGKERRNNLFHGPLYFISSLELLIHRLFKPFDVEPVDIYNVIWSKSMAVEKEFLTTIPYETVSAFIDIGAAYGFYTRYMLKRARKIIVVEPDPRLTPFLTELAKKHKHVELVPRPLAETRKKVRFFISDVPISSSICHQVSRVAIDIQATTLDDILTYYGITNDLFIKLDVEGAELDVLAGGKQALRRCKWILVECHPLTEDIGIRMNKVCNVLEHAGLTIIRKKKLKNRGWVIAVR